MPNISIDVVADVARARASLDSIQSSTSHMSTGFDKAKESVKNLAEGFLGLEAVEKVGDALKDCVGAARNFNKQVAITDTVVKNAGGKLKLTTDQLTKFADKTSLATGTTSTDILQLVDNIGKFGDITGKRLKETAKQTLNIAAVSGKGAVMVSRTLNKAISDPIKGLTTLGTLGVHITDKQTARITKLQNAGKLAAAQQVVLNQVQKQFGGAAAAAATPGAKFKALLEQLEVRIGNQLIPVLNRFELFLLKNLPKAIAFLGPKLTLLGNTIKKYVFPAVETLFKFFEAHHTILAVVAGLVISLIDPFASAAAAVIYLYKRFQVFRDVVQDTVKGVKATVKGLVAAFNFLKPVFKAVVAAIRVQLKVLITAVKVQFAIWKLEFKLVEVAARFLWHNVIKPVFDGIKATIKADIAAVKTTFNDFKAAFHLVASVVRDTWSTIKSIFSLGVSFVGSKISEVKSKITSTFSDAKNLLSGVGADIVGGLVRGIENAKGLVVGAAKDLANILPSWVKKTLHIASPSKVMRKLGQFSGMGVALGLNDTAAQVTKSAKALANNITNGFGNVSLATPQVAVSGNVFAGSSRAGSVTVNVYANAILGNEHDVQNWIAKGLKGYTKRNGPIRGLASA